MRPLLHPGLSCVWRDATTLQIGTTPGRALVIGGLGPVAAAVLRAMNGHNDLSTLRALATTAGSDVALVDRLVDVLLSAGAAIDREQFSNAPAPARHHEPDQSSLGLIDRVQDGGRGAFARRARARVEVAGAARVGASIARLLDAGGVGEIDVDDQNLVAPGDVSPAGHPREAVGLARDRSLRSLLAGRGDVRAHDADAAGTPSTTGPDFVVLALAPGVELAGLIGTLLRAGIPHLHAQVHEVTGVVGPLVVPGTSACLRCLDLHRTDRDSGWPVVVDQATRKPPLSPPCDASLATAVAGLAAGQVLAYIDGYEVAAIGGTIEMELPYGLPRRRSWRTHPDCGCTWLDEA